MDIKCRKTSCKFNDRYTCVAKGIEIRTDTECATFVPDETKKAQDYSKNMFEADLEYSNSRHIKDVKLHCDSVGCLFNKECHCCANGITVLDEGKGKTACATFIKDN